ncbi:hypothetical protein MUB24_09550 [Lederbergia sp. NSJ-179]|uniref:hypothetical protein n=1 Tax=Lederbergia sp. NSJ-179 TaxID=2931402 RepID=UPI001FCF9426|nr:hypothetical protein [Lederbergia sp. NSJ-179]MCJ7841134.1 hypothetical protein [Lederbergia sp. NSJ-179]
MDNGTNPPGIILPKHSELNAEYEEYLLVGIVVIIGEAMRMDEGEWKNTLYRPVEDETKAIQMKAIPYYAWCNRDPGETLVGMNG